VTSGDATLAAASIAALASLLSLLVSVRSARSAEARAAQRDAVGPSLEALSQCLHDCVASATVALEKHEGSEGRRNWMTRGNDAAEELKALRPRLRLTLDGLDEGLRTLSRVPHWAQNYHDAADARVFLRRATALRKALDRAVIHAYRQGRAPRRRDVWWVNRKATLVRAQWNEEFPRDQDDASLAAIDYQ
jgi:hypothetical protein